MSLQTRIQSDGLEFNDEFRKAISIMENSKRDIFITGRAGTGKTTLLKEFKSISSNNVAVLAPTGVAALNVNGQTIHSFCRFKPDITLEKVEKLSGVSYATANMYRSLQTIIIDEISMVRADLLDCLDKFMRLNGPDRNAPFGGVQVILVGDLYQLPPVVTQEESGIFEGPYKSPYFFDSNVFRELKLEFIELKECYRQKNDHEFIALLNAIRDGTASEKDLERINGQVDPFHAALAENMYVTLTTTNSLADSINKRHLDMISKVPHSYKAVIDGKFGKRMYPADEVLTVKEGAQVMMLNNDPKKRWLNGSLAKIVSVLGNKLIVELDDGTCAEVLPYTWKTSKLSYDKANRKIVSDDTGSFTQYPLMLAWAVTIHKSQGKTFDRVIIDVGDGTFAHGQLYVALSRCRALEGIVLKQRLKKSYMIIDDRISEFYNKHFKNC
ncbi:MAG: AAA family ATPase [Candidatus Marsarchaeota archaeon]|nr:AAA family ATPase [Candidatus Marsarchaeota archaeon]